MLCMLRYWAPTNSYGNCLLVEVTSLAQILFVETDILCPLLKVPWIWHRANNFLVIGGDVETRYSVDQRFQWTNSSLSRTNSNVAGNNTHWLNSELILLLVDAFPWGGAGLHSEHIQVSTGSSSFRGILCSTALFTNMCHFNCCPS